MTICTSQMGDISHGSTPGLGQDDRNRSQAAEIVGGPPAYQGKPTTQEYEQAAQQQQYTVSSQSPFANQFDMTQSSPVARQGPYNMGPMANSLPQVAYRPGQYVPGSQPRYNPATSPSMINQMPHMQAFAGHPSMPMANHQGYYVQQPQMAPYYGVSQMSPTQAAPPRQNIAYYPGQMMINHAQSAYYYQPTTQYPAQAPTLPSGMMPGPFMPAHPTTNDTHTPNHSPESTGPPVAKGGHVPKSGTGTFLSHLEICRLTQRQKAQTGDRVLYEGLPANLDRVVRLLVRRPT